MQYHVYSSKHKKFFGQNGFIELRFRDDIAKIKSWDDPMQAQDWADGLNLARCGFDHEQVQKPEEAICHVVDEKGHRWEPPPWKGDKHYAEREKLNTEVKC